MSDDQIYNNNIRYTITIYQMSKTRSPQFTTYGVNFCLTSFFFLISANEEKTVTAFS